MAGLQTLNQLLQVTTKPLGYLWHLDASLSRFWLESWRDFVLSQRIVLELLRGLGEIHLRSEDVV
jgi:hypothetical protein